MYDDEPRQDKERLPRTVETFAVLDLDRTLLDTSALTEKLCLQLLQHGVSADQVRKDIDFVRRSDGLSFSMLDFLQAQYGQAKYTSVLHEIEEQVKTGHLTDELLCTGTFELLAALEAYDVPYAVLTYGERINQEFKLTLLRYMVNRSTKQLHGTVTSEPKKALWIAGDAWREEGKAGFVVPAFIYPQADLHAKHVVIIDDKRANLESDDETVRGILVDNTDGSSALSTADVARMLADGMDLLSIADRSSALLTD